MARMQALIARLCDPRLPAAAALVAMILALPGLWVGWQLDDNMHRLVLLGKQDTSITTLSAFDLFAFLDGDPERNQAMMDLGVLPWWTFKELRLTFWRPVCAFTHWVDYRLWPDSPVPMHAQSIVWFGGLVAVAALLYRRLGLPAWTAGLAGLLFAVDDAHGLPAGWLANRNALLGGVCGLLAILFHARWRRKATLWSLLPAPAFLLLGLFSAEAALGACAYLFAYALFLDHGCLARRILSLVPCGLAGGTWLIVYNHLGYGAFGSGYYVDPLAEPFEFAKAVVLKAPLLLLGQWGLPPSSLFVLLPKAVIHGLWVGAVLFLVVVALVLYPLVRRDRTARFFCAGMLLSLVPVCATAPHDRLLLFAGFGAMGLLAQFLAALREKQPWLPDHAAFRIPARILAPLFVVIHLVLAPALLPLSVYSPAQLGFAVEGAAEALPDDPGFQDKTLIITHAPYPFFSHHLLLVRGLKGLPGPRAVRVLAPGVHPVEITREDARTLSVRPERGFLVSPFDDLFRGPAHPLTLGRTVKVAGMTATIKQVNASRRPQEVVFRFDVPLEDTSLKWVQWRGRTYVPFVPPPIGDTIRLPAQGLF